VPTYAIGGTVTIFNPAITVNDAIGNYLCRQAAGPYVAEAASGAVSVPRITAAEPMVIRDTSTGRYYPALLKSYDACTTFPTGAARQATLVTGLTTPLVGGGTPDTIQFAFPDGSHPGPYAESLWFQAFMEATWEDVYEPPVTATGNANLMPNGRLESDCNADANWSLAGAGAATKQQSSWSQGTTDTNAAFGAYRGTA
jgi:hypothetical protein